MKNKYSLLNIEKLKNLNLISVLKNLNDKELENILSKINVLKLSNIVNKLKCEKCNEYISKHPTCRKCSVIECQMFYNLTYDVAVCLNCSSNLKIWSWYSGYYYIENKIGYRMHFNTQDDINYQEGPITKEKALELFKKYTDY